MATTREDELRGAVEFGAFRFEPGNGLWRGGDEVPLPPRALAVLTALAAHPGKVVSKQALMDAVWKDAFVTEASLLEAIRVLREALGDDRHRPAYIQTIHRRGYRFVAEVRAVPERDGGQDFSASSGHQFARVEGSSAEAEGMYSAPPYALEPERGAAWRPLIVAAAAGILAIVGIAIVFAVLGQHWPEPRPTTRFTIALPEGLTLDPLRGSVAVSADGLRMVYVALETGRPRLFLRTVDRDAPEVIDGSDGAADPFFSPDGEWVGFFAHGSLKKLRIDGGAPIALCAARPGAGASWGRDGTIVFGGGPGGGLARVSQDGGEPITLIAPAAGSRDVSYGWPDVLPDRAGVLYTAVNLAGSRLAIFDVERSVSHPLIDAGAFGRYSPTGHVVFERRGRLEAAPFSLSERRVTAPPRPILHGLATSDATLSGPRFAFSRTGSLIYVPHVSSDVDDRLHWLDPHGALEPVPLPPAALRTVDVSPDLRQLAMTVESDTGADLWVADLHRGGVSRLSSDGRSVNPAWRPDGLEIAFAYSKAGPFNIFTRPPDSHDAPHPLTESPWNQFPTSWSPDGRRLAFTEFNPLTGADVWLLDLATRERHPLVRTLFDESHARFSPDGRWVAYMSNEAGRWDVFIRQATEAGRRLQVSTNGGAWPCWSVDGRTLYFSANGQAAAVAVSTTPALAVSPPMIIPGRDDVQLASGHASAGRVLVRQGGVVPARRELRVVLEWFSELAGLTGAKTPMRWRRWAAVPREPA